MISVNPNHPKSIQTDIIPDGFLSHKLSLVAPGHSESIKINQLNYSISKNVVYYLTCHPQSHTSSFFQWSSTLCDFDLRGHPGSHTVDQTSYWVSWAGFSWSSLRKSHLILFCLLIMLHLLPCIHHSHFPLSVSA